VAASAWKPAPKTPDLMAVFARPAAKLVLAPPRWDALPSAPTRERGVLCA
jgi:hypothetical protein